MPTLRGLLIWLTNCLVQVRFDFKLMGSFHSSLFFEKMICLVFNHSLDSGIRKKGMHFAFVFHSFLILNMNCGNEPDYLWQLNNFYVKIEKKLFCLLKSGACNFVWHSSGSVLGALTRTVIPKVNFLVLALATLQWCFAWCSCPKRLFQTLCHENYE